MPITLRCDGCGKEYRFAKDLMARVLDGSPHASLPIGMRFILRFGWRVQCSGTLRATEPLEPTSADIDWRKV